MRYVIEKHAESLGFSVDACESYQQATESLEQQFQQYGTEYSGVLFGWPTTAQDDATACAQLLENSDHKDLPVIVMSTDMRAETRAWAASRDNTAVLAWKEYQGLEGLLRQLIDVAPDDSGDVDTADTVLDNADVHLLVVDDSATIRYSLRDLFQLRGYRVTLAATRDEAMRQAKSTAFDIAVLDYYLTETTGDVLCRELLATEATGDIVCTVLTGTYSDHIIKRSLRAGAVECMFKNESSELLLSRIDAISRFVRQKRQLQVEQQLLADVLECIAGAVILVNSENRIVYVNALAIQELGLTDKSQLMGSLCSTFLETDGPQAAGQHLHPATWRLPEGREIEVDYQHSLIESSGHSLLRFAQRVVAIADADLNALQQSEDPEVVVNSVISQLALAEDSAAFLLEMLQYLAVARKALRQDKSSTKLAATRVSFLVLDVFTRTDEGELESVDKHVAEAAQVSESLHGVFSRDDHVTKLGDNRYGFLLCHAEDSQAYVLTRKIMQRCLEAVPADTQTTTQERHLACTGSLLSLTRNAAQPMNVLVQHAFKGLDLINEREPNQALLLDVRRMLSAYPVVTE